MKLLHDYYIIESLPSKDIKDGEIFLKCLKSLGGRFNPIYRRVNNIKEFENALAEFSSLNYRHLFISAHGDEENIVLVEENINAYDLFEMNIDLSQRRIFMSTCKGGSFLLAKYFIKKKAYSVIGSPDNLNQIVAVGMWPTMVLIFERQNQNRLDFNELNKTLKLLTKVYEINLAFYSFIRNQSKMKEYIYTPNRRERCDYEI